MYTDSFERWERKWGLTGGRPATYIRTIHVQLAYSSLIGGYVCGLQGVNVCT